MLSPRLRPFLLSLGPEIRSGGRAHQRGGPYSLFLLARAGVRRPSRARTICDAGRAVPLGGGGLRRRGHRTPVRRGGAIRSGAGSARCRRGVRRTDRCQWHGRRGRYATPPARVYTGDQVPGRVSFPEDTAAPGTVVVEFPLGEWAYEVRYVFYSTAHWHPLFNGYSGHVPAELQPERDTPAPPTRLPGRVVEHA